MGHQPPLKVFCAVVPTTGIFQYQFVEETCDGLDIAATLIGALFEPLLGIAETLVGEILEFIIYPIIVPPPISSL